jgi:hypothetical protein
MSFIGRRKRVKLRDAGCANREQIADFTPNI